MTRTGRRPTVPGSTPPPTQLPAGGQRILASLTIDGTALTVESNGARRFDEVVDTVRGAVPSASLISESRVPAAEMIRRQRGRTAGAAEPVDLADPADPAIVEAMRSFTADYETRWLDMELPALAGLTPRQAADDPTRREDLVRLLNSFENRPVGPGAMSPARLREALRL